MGDFKSVRPKPFDVRSLKLSAEEGFVLSRVDAPVSVRELVTMTGLAEERVVEIVGLLAEQGAVDVERAAEEGLAIASDFDPDIPVLDPVLDLAPESDPLPDLERDASHDRDSAPVPAADTDPDSVSDADSDADADADSASDADADAASDADADADPDADPEIGDREYRKIYESIYRHMSRDARAAAAQTVEGSHLVALCLDPEPMVVAAVMSNPKVGLEHARTIAFHHRTAAGLELCARRTDVMADSGVQRRLLRNPQLPETLLRKIVHSKPLLEVYRISIDRENPERSRVKVRELLRKKFTIATADERAALLIKTEGRALIILAGCPLDAHTTTILCGKTTYTVMFVQNIARFSAAPPALLSHLLKQPLVRRNFGLRKLLLQHRNTPAEAKKNF